MEYLVILTFKNGQEADKTFSDYDAARDYADLFRCDNRLRDIEIYNAKTGECVD